MILVDTSVWIDHLDRGDALMTTLLESHRVLIHPHVIGEIALGNLQHRDRILNTLSRLPLADVASDHEVMTLIGRQALFGAGIGYVDAHLIAATLLTNDATLLTRDRRLHTLAERLDIAATP